RLKHVVIAKIDDRSRACSFGIYSDADVLQGIHGSHVFLGQSKSHAEIRDGVYGVVQQTVRGDITRIEIGEESCVLLRIDPHALHGGGERERSDHRRSPTTAPGTAPPW